MTSEEAIKTAQEMEKAIRTGKAQPVVQTVMKEDGSTSVVTAFTNKNSVLYVDSKRDKKAKDLQKENERLELLLNQVCAYVVELLDPDDLNSAEHSAICFGMNRKEHKKYILGE